MSLIDIKHASKIYQMSDDIVTTALSDVSFQIEKGEFVAIIGPSGSGKSTLMHILGALDAPTSGEYLLNGRSVSHLSEDQLAEVRNQQIGFVFQAYNLLPRTSALRNVIIPMIYGGITKSKREKLAKSLLSSVGLADRLYHTSNQLSGGQQQRVAIARALAMNPSIVLADEPTGNISGQHVDEIMQTFTKLNQNGHTIIIITHEPDVAVFAHRVLTLKDGRLVHDSRSTKNKSKK